MEEFKSVFSKYLKIGMDIIYIGCSLKQSSSVNTGEVVAKQLMEEYPDSKIICIDSLNASYGIAMLAIRAAEYRDSGMDTDTIVKKIMADRNKVNEYCTVHTLDYLKRASRVKASSAFLGNLFGVKPIIISDKNGYQTPIKKVRGRQNSLNELVNLLKESIVEPENQCIYIAHADCENEAKYLKELIEKEIQCRDIHIGYIGPIIGASVGPDAIAVFGFGKEITFAG